ncbi:MAG: tyrosine-protein phosphatase [Erythrobacter sp.]|uniref:tyrosine-protein phosphatase n=1 Tax=Erythrobacter sp. TaxID=1042 RepID=UPI002638EE45|nr:tyrosine-protein phosphatase [Erythrobacter sp.]MDJ0977399.1 tyrosine-protein phosphatase [Erythrobacter sp.]
MRLMMTCAALALSLAACNEQANKADAAGTIGSVVAEHGNTPNDYTITWDGGASVTIEVSADPGFAKGEGEVIGEFDGGKAAWSATGEAERRYFLLSADSGEQERVAVRLLPLEGGRNFRDIGGYETKDGRTVKWGRVYRSGVMANLTDGDYEYLSDLGVTTVCDFREADEREAEPTDWRAGEIDYLTFAPPPEDGSERAMFAPLMDPEATPDDVRNAMAKGYPDIAVREDEGYTAMFDQLAAGNIPLAFNCSAGKDRAGTAAAMLLTALGVPRETVVADYALSDDYVDYMAEFLDPEARERGEDGPYAFLMKLPPEKVAPLMESNPIYIEATLDAMTQEHGSVLAYIQTEFDVTDRELAAIREQLIE